MSNLYPQKVKLTENHEYLDDNNARYMGFSKFCDEFLIKPFNSTGAAYGVAKSAINKGENMSAQEVLDGWEQQRDNGVRIDSAVQLFLETKTILPENDDVSELINSVCAEYATYKSTHCQSVVYNEYYKVGGSPDLFGLTSNRADGQFEMSDIKCFEKDDNLYDHKGWLFEPMSHLSNTKVMKITLQLSFYAFQLEGLLGKRCRKLFIHLINPTTKTHQKIVVPYLKNDIILLLEHNKEKILEYSNKPEESLF